MCEGEKKKSKTLCKNIQLKSHPLVMRFFMNTIFTVQANFEYKC